MSKLSKRIAGNMRAKEDLNTALAAWFQQLAQHLLGLVGRMQAIGSKLDEDMSCAIQEIQGYLRDQPSSTTSEQVSLAQQRMGPVWIPQQEQEVVRLAAMLRAFGAVSPPGHTALNMLAAGMPMAAHPIRPADQQSEVSFSEVAGSALSVQPDRSAQGNEGTSTVGRWKRRSGGAATRPSKSPRRETSMANAPWVSETTGRNRKQSGDRARPRFPETTRPS